MSGLASVVYPAPTPQGFTEWVFSHYVHHQAIISAVQQTKGIHLVLYDIYPFNDRNLDNWLQQHQSQHTDMTSVFGINGVDLTNLDFKDRRQLDAWMDLHYREHLAVASDCGLPI